MLLLPICICSVFFFLETTCVFTRNFRKNKPRLLLCYKPHPLSWVLFLFPLGLHFYIIFVKFALLVSWSWSSAFCYYFWILYMLCLFFILVFCYTIKLCSTLLHRVSRITVDLSQHNKYTKFLQTWFYSFAFISATVNLNKNW